MPTFSFLGNPMYRNSLTSYGSVAKFLHWLLAILIILMLIVGYSLDSIPKDYKGMVYNTHKLTGICIFILGVIYILWTLINVRPRSIGFRWRFEIYLARTVHFLLFTTVVVMPLAGLIGASASGKGPMIGDFKIQLPIAQNKALVSVAFSVHRAIAVLIIILVALHTLAAFFHHCIRKDKVLVRMLPESK